MKVRWTCHSVRLRISPGELAALLRGETVSEPLCLPPGADGSHSEAWRATVVTGEATGFAFAAGEARITLCAADRSMLAEPEREGLYFNIEGEPVFRYFIEKDFPCIHPGAAEAMEPAYETFEPPSGFEARKSG